MKRWLGGDPDAVVRDVLAGAAYRHVPKPSASASQTSLQQILWTWLREHVGAYLSPLFRAFAHAGGGRLGALLGYAFVGLALALLALAAYRLAVGLERAARRRPRSDGAEDVRAPSYDAAAWRQRAREAAARNDFADAIAALFAAALALLDERAVVAFDPSRTPGEYRRAVRRERALAASAFDDLARRFVLAAYARERPDALAYAEADRAFERFEPAALA